MRVTSGQPDEASQNDDRSDDDVDDGHADFSENTDQIAAATATVAAVMSATAVSATQPFANQIGEHGRNLRHAARH